jgi:carbonic anhydrase/acetyltransferase-like protein (isoleucine patch superfamily)
LRADLNKITLDGYVNVQDGAVITTDDRASIGGFDSEVQIGGFTTIGHGARLHACKVEDECLIGNGAIVLEGAVVEHGAVVAAGSVVPPGRRIPHMELWAGNPAVFKRTIGKMELAERKALAVRYFALAKRHAMEFSTIPTQIYKQAEDLINQIEKVLPFEPILPTAHWNVSKQLTINADMQYWEENDPKNAIEAQIARQVEREKLMPTK